MQMIWHKNWSYKPTQTAVTASWFWRAALVAITSLLLGDITHRHTYCTSTENYSTAEEEE